MRFVPYKQQVRCPDTDAFLGIANIAFSLRLSDDGGLSMQWVEYYGAKSAATYSAAAIDFRDNLPSKRLGPTGYFAIGNVGHSKAVAADAGKQIRIVHEPDGTNMGHASVRRFDDEDRALLDTLAIDVFSEHVAVSSLALP